MKTFLIICLLSIAVLASSLVTIKSGRTESGREKNIATTLIKKTEPKPCAIKVFTSEGCPGNSYEKHKERMVLSKN